MDKLEEMDKFLETYSLPRLGHKKQTIWTDQSLEVKSNLLKRKQNSQQQKSRTKCLYREFYQTFKEELILNLFKLHKQTERYTILMIWMDKDVIYMYIMDKDVRYIYIYIYIYSGMLLSQKWNLTILDNMDGSISYYAKWNVR